MSLFSAKSLLRQVFASFGIKFANVALSLLLAVLLARVLGVSGYGDYAFVYAIVMMLAIPSQMGLPQLVVRETARADRNQDWAAMRTIWRWAHLFVILSSFGTMTVVLIWVVLRVQETGIRNAFIFGLLLIPLIALGNVRGAALSGLGKVVLGQLPENVLRPLCLFAGLSSAAYLVAQGQMTAAGALGLHVGAAGFAFLVGSVLLSQNRPRYVALAEASPPQTRAWLMAAGAFGLLAGLQTINSTLDIVMIGIMRSREEVGIYKIAVTAAGLTVLGLQVINIVIMPRIAHLHAGRELKAMQALVTTTARLILLAAGLASLVLIVFGKVLIGYAFGADFVAGYPALVVLTLGQLANAAFGSVGLLLNMSGHERFSLVGVAIACVANVCLNLVLIPLFGILGAATATAVTLVIWNVVLYWQVWQKLGIDSAAIRLMKTRAL